MECKNYFFKYFIYFNTSLKTYYLNIIVKIKDAVPPLVKTAAKIFATPIKTPKK